ncbi:tetratricopeptide repeat protein [Streptomyces sp. CAU 1734]|uniref:tetratricopeptide repeat protein n=1 Tax=Streptomyces sp. CAU 1734 TaxID=3140360 RepID=UPI00326182E1
MPAEHRRPRNPNRDLEQLLDAAAMSRKGLAKRVNDLSALAGTPRGYTHTSASNWIDRGMIPRPPVPALIAATLGERLGRRVTLHEIGMGAPDTSGPDIGLDFPRDPEEALRNAAQYWSTVDRRTLLTRSGPFAVAAFTSPVHRWLADPADPPTAREDGRRVGRADLDELWDAAEEARRWDSKYGGGNWKSSSVLDCLQHRAAPLLRGSYTEHIGAELCTVTSELARIAAWSAVDMGQYDAAQRHFIQALRLARSAGDVQAGSYVLATMALASFLRGHTAEAIDMAEGAYERAKHQAAPRVLAFAKLAAARAYGRAGDAKRAITALAASERLLDSIQPHTRDPQWLTYLTHARLSTDATEIHHHLGNPQAALRWSRQALPMPAGVYTRAVGLRTAVVSATHLQAGDLDRGLALGERAVDILGQVRSARAHDYIRNINHALQPWQKDQRVTAFLTTSNQALAGA